MSDAPRPKIIVDDDWKTRVQAEKEALAQKEHATENGTIETSEAKPQASADPAAGGHHLPPPSFPLLVSTLATEALAALGQLRGPDNKPTPIDLEHAKHFIDTLGMLEQKTKGNLTTEEAAMLENVLHELRLAFVAVSSRGA